MAGDWQLRLMPLEWVHPETLVTINNEDMPDELHPYPTSG